MVKKILAGLFVGLFLLLNTSAFVFAEPATPAATDKPKSTLLPAADETAKECFKKYSSKSNNDLKKKLVDDWNKEGQVILACGIKTGQMGLWMVPFYMRYMLEFIIQISGLACVAATVYGGFLYMFAGISEDKEKGKKAITYGIIGMIITFLAWAIVNIFIILLTSA